MNKILRVLLCCVVSLFLISCSQNKNINEKIDSLLIKESKNLNHGGISFTLSSDKTNLLSKSYGWANEESKQKMEPDSTYAIASITKLFTTVAVMQLVERGDIDLDLPLSSYIDGFSLMGMDEKDITLRLILIHYSGLPSDFMKGYISQWDGYTNIHDYIPELILQLNKEHIVTNGDTFYRYSNTGFELASYIVSKVSGLSFSEYVEKNILKPLKMNNSGFPDRGEREAGIVTGYTAKKETNILYLRGTGEGDLISTTEDVTLFGRSFINNNEDILKSDTKELVLSKQNKSNRYDMNLIRALGWQGVEVPGYPGHFYYFHEGGLYPFSSMLVIIPSINRTFSILCNEDEYDFEILTYKIIQNLMESETGKKPVKLNNNNKTEPVDPSYYGVYASELGMMKIQDSLFGPQVNFLGMNLNLVRELDGYYGLQYRLFGIIPLPIEDLKGIKIKAQKSDIVSFGLFTWGKYRGLMTLVDRVKIDKKWEDRLGEYTILNSDKTNFVTSFSIDIDPIESIPVMKVSVISIPDTLTFPIDLSSPNRAIISGYGRHMGDWITVEQLDGEEVLRYSGYLLRKKE